MLSLKSRLSAAVILIAFANAAKAQTIEIPELVVTATRTPEPLAQVGSAISVIPAEEIEKSSLRSVDDLFRQVPGLTLTQAGGPGRAQTVRIRGGDVRHTLVLIDGIRVNDPSLTGREFDFSNLVLADIERIEVLRGPQSALYGSDAMGGVINIITKRGSGPPKATVSVEAGSYGTKETRGTVSGSDERVDFSLGFGALETSGFSAYGYRIPRLARYAPPGGFDLDGSGRLGVTGRVGVKIDEDTRVELGGSVNSNRYDFDAAFPPYPDTPSKGKSELANIYGRLIADSFGGALRSTATVFANRTERETKDVFFFGFAGPPTTFASRTRYIGERAGAEYQGDLKLRSFGLFTFGAKIEREQADSFAQDLLPPPPTRWRRTIAAEQTTRSLFAQHQVTLGDRLHLTFGGRVDDVTSPDRLITGEPGSSPHSVDRFATVRATAAYDIWETGTKLRASVGTGGKAPSLFQLFSPSYGTPTLESERSVGMDAGIDQTWLDGRAKVSATIFTNRYRNLIDFNANAADCRPGQFFGCYFNVARATTSGLELSGDLAVVPEFARLRLAYTHLEAFDDVTGLRLARRPQDEGRVSVAFTPNARLTIEPILVLVSQRYDLPNEEIKLPPYARLDLRAEYKLDDTFTLFGRAENLTDARYEEVANYGTPGRSFYGGLRATW